MLVSQAVAIRTVRKQTGLSGESAAVRVKQLAKISGVLDGKRVKVHSAEVDRIIAEVNTPVIPPRPAGIRPFSEKQIARIRATVRYRNRKA